MKSEYSAYIHSNGTLQVKKCVFGEDLIDTSSPFVKHYLGRVEAADAQEAKNLFIQRIITIKDIMTGIKDGQ